MTISAKKLEQYRGLASFWKETPGNTGWATIVLELTSECERLAEVNRKQRKELRRCHALLNRTCSKGKSK